MLPRQPERPPPPTQLMWGDIPPEMAAPRTPAPGSTVQGPGSCHAGSRAPLLDLVTQGPPDTENRVTSSHEPRDLGGAHPRGPGFPPGLWGQGAADCRSGSVQAAPRLRPRCWVSPCLPLALVSAHLPCPPPTPPPPSQSPPQPQPQPGDRRHQLPWRGCWSLGSLGLSGSPARGPSRTAWLPRSGERRPLGRTWPHAQAPGGCSAQTRVLPRRAGHLGPRVRSRVCQALGGPRRTRWTASVAGWDGRA